LRDIRVWVMGHLLGELDEYLVAELLRFQAHDRQPMRYFQP
jgi:hypothetical protein